MFGVSTESVSEALRILSARLRELDLSINELDRVNNNTEDCSFDSSDSPELDSFLSEFTVIERRTYGTE